MTHRLVGTEGESEGERSSTHLLTFTRLPPPGGERSECDEPPSPSWPGPQKPQAHNECHTVVTTCTFMGRREGEREGTRSPVMKHPL